MSKKLSLLLIVLLLVVPMTLAACGGDDDKDDKKDGDSKAVELKQEFKSVNGVVVKYPEGWVAQDSADQMSVEIASDAAALAEGAEPQAGQAALMVMALPMAMLAESGMSSPKDALGMFSAEVSGEEGGEVGEIKDIKIGGKEAYRIDVKDNKTEGFMVAFLSGDDTLIVGAALTAPGEIGNFEATLLKMLESVKFEGVE